MTVVVDPYLLSIPKGDNITSGDIRQYITRLLHWDQVFRNDPDYVVSSSAMSQMYHLGLVPDGVTLQKTLQDFGIEEFSAYDIAEGCKTLFENYPHMEERAVSMGVQCLKESRKIIPNEIESRLHPKIAEVFCEALIATSYAISILSEDEIWTLATVPFFLMCSDIVVRGDVIDNTKSVTIEMRWPYIVSPNQFGENVSIEEKILAVYEKNPLMALQISWNKLKEQYPGFPEIAQFKISFTAKFVPSILDKKNKRTAFKKDVVRVFDSIAYSLTNKWQFGSDKHHVLRENINDRTSERQLRKRNAKLVDKASRIESIAGTNPLHTHYWQCHDGSYEISNITDDHDDPTIYQ